LHLLVHCSAGHAAVFDIFWTQQGKYGSQEVVRQQCQGTTILLAGIVTPPLMVALHHARRLFFSNSQQQVRWVVGKEDDVAPPQGAMFFS
jgi:hypothetical protein